MVGEERKDPLSVGVVGCGGIACQYHLRILASAPGAEVVGVADPRAEARERAAALTGAEAVADPAELIGGEAAEAIVVCAENRAHGELAVAVAEAGKHLYLEKPIALTLADSRAAVAAAERSGKVAAMGFNFRSLPLYRDVRERLRDGEIGRVTAVRTRFCEPVAGARLPAWKRERRSGGGALLDLGSHHIDLFRWLCDDEPATVEAASITSAESEHDAARFAALGTAGTRLDAEFSFREGRACTWEFEGESGRLVVDRIAGTARRANGRLPAPGRLGAALRARWRALPVPRREPSFALSLARFVDAARTGGDEDLPRLRDGLRSLEVALAVESAAGVA